MQFWDREKIELEPLGPQLTVENWKVLDERILQNTSFFLDTNEFYSFPILLPGESSLYQAILISEKKSILTYFPFRGKQEIKEIK